MLTAEQIAQAKATTRYSLDKPHHEHDDCIRIAYEWLDAQDTIARKPTHCFALKSMIERWGGRYVSQSDVEIAAALHPHLCGEYPRFNLSTRLVLPNDARLDGIGQAMTQNYRDNGVGLSYFRREDGSRLQSLSDRPRGVPNLNHGKPRQS